MSQPHPTMPVLARPWSRIPTSAAPAYSAFGVTTPSTDRAIRTAPSVGRSACASLVTAHGDPGSGHRGRDSPWRSATQSWRPRDPHEVTEPTFDLATRLTKSARAVAASATDGELGAVRRHQALDRTYEVVDRLLRDEPGADELSDAELAEVRDIVRALSGLVSRWRTPEPLRVYRGLRSRAGLTDLRMITRSSLPPPSSATSPSKSLRSP